jgi:hypothetical protein
MMMTFFIAAPFSDPARLGMERSYAPVGRRVHDADGQETAFEAQLHPVGCRDLDLPEELLVRLVLAHAGEQADIAVEAFHRSSFGLLTPIVHPEAAWCIGAAPDP